MLLPISLMLSQVFSQVIYFQTNHYFNHYSQVKQGPEQSGGNQPMAGQLELGDL